MNSLDAIFQVNAIVMTNILGGSTNVVLHLLAVARSAGVDLPIEEFQEIASRTPFLGNLSPSGKYTMSDLHKVGGIPAVMKYILENTNLLNGDVLTCTGKTMRENLRHVPELDFSEGGQDVIRPLERPVKPIGHLSILSQFHILSTSLLLPQSMPHEAGQSSWREATRFQADPLPPPPPSLFCLRFSFPSTQRVT